jgi:hypothetical protein
MNEVSVSATQPNGSTPFLVDSHVHYYPCFDKYSLLAGAAGNFASAAARLGIANPVGMLIFVENCGSRDLTRLVTEVRQDKAGPWAVSATNEASSVTVYREGAPRLVLLPGRQIKTAEALEVLAIDCSADIPDGKPVRETLKMVYAAGSLAVVPWGFGKWVFGRGRLVSDLVQEEAPGRFFLGDNGGRPSPSPRPRQFQLAVNRGLCVLPGTDPLPIPGEEVRAGAYGFIVPDLIDQGRPGESLRRYLENPATSLLPYGRGSSWPACLRRQVLLRTGGSDRRI